MPPATWHGHLARVPSWPRWPCHTRGGAYIDSYVCGPVRRCATFRASGPRQALPRWPAGDSDTAFFSGSPTRGTYLGKRSMHHTGWLNEFPPIPALRYLVRHSRHHHPRQSRHGRENTRKPLAPPFFLSGNEYNVPSVTRFCHPVFYNTHSGVTCHIPTPCEAWHPSTRSNAASEETALLGLQYDQPVCRTAIRMRSHTAIRASMYAPPTTKARMYVWNSHKLDSPLRTRLGCRSQVSIADCDDFQQGQS